MEVVPVALNMFLLKVSVGYALSVSDVHVPLYFPSKLQHRALAPGEGEVYISYASEPC